MKKTFTLMLLAVFGLSAQAQKSYETFPRNPVVTGDYNEVELVAHSWVKNNDTVDMEISWRRIENNLQTGWTAAICDYITCYSSDVDSGTFDLGAGDSAILDLHFYPDSTAGSGEAVLMVWEGDNEGDADTITYNAQTWAASLARFSKNPTLTVYPNPTKGVLHVSYTGNANAQVEIIDVLGKRLMTFTQTSDKETFDVSELPNGLYVIRITDQGMVQSKTFRKAN